MPISNTRRLSVSVRATLALCLFPVIAPAAGAATPAVPALQVAGAAGTHHYTIPPQPLYSALDALAEQAGLQLVYSAELVQALDSRGLTGDYTPEDALTRLLARTGLEYRYTGPDTVTLARLNPLDALLAEATKPRQYAGATEPPPKKPDAPAQEDADDVTVLPPLTVTASPWGDPSYNVLDATTATKTDTPIMETPFSIQVIPQQVFRDQQVVRIPQALRNVSGVDPDVPDTGNFTIRGFNTTFIYRDGVRFDSNFGGVAAAELANLERIEVLKGPASMLYGRIEPGGLINLIRKKPLASPYYALEQQFGSFDFYRTTLDASGPITQDDTLLYRFNLAYEDAGSFRDFTDSERVFVAPALRWNLGPRTQADFYVEYLHDREPRDSGIPALGNRPAPVPRERRFDEPGSDREVDDVRVGLHWSHAFNDRWTLRQRFDANFFERPLATSVFLADNRVPENCTRQSCPLPRFIFESGGDGQDYQTSLDLTGKVETWGLEHNMLLGGDYLNFRSFGKSRFNFSAPSIDLFNPSYSGVSAFRPLLDNPHLAFSDNTFTEEWYGLYLQDQVKLPYDLQLLAGFRYDDVRTGGRRHDATVGESESSLTVDAVTPRYALLWRPLPELSLFGSYAENFGVSNGQDVLRRPLPPQEAEQWEVGLKTELLDGRLSGTLAWYDLTKTNISVPSADPVLAAQGLVDVAGEIRSRGLELDVSGEVLPGWKLIGSYAYTDSEITKDRQAEFDDAGNVTGFNNGNQGNRFRDVPWHSGSFWTTFEPQESLWRGLTLGAGVFAQSQRERNEANTVQLPGYATIGLLARYTHQLGPSRISLQLNVDNLLDKHFFESGSGITGAPFPGAPRTFLGSVRVEF